MRLRTGLDSRIFREAALSCINMFPQAKQRLRLTTIWPYLLFFVASLVSLVWTQGKLIYFLNESLPFNPPLDVSLYLQPWVSIYGHGGPFNAINIFIYSLPFYFLFLLGLNLTQSLSVLFFVILLTSGIGFFKLANVILGEKDAWQFKFAAASGALFYMNNYFVMEALLANGYPEWEAYAVIPIFLFAAMKIFSGRGKCGNKILYIVCIVVSSIVIGNLAEPYPPVLAIFLGAFVVFMVYEAVGISRRGKVRLKAFNFSLPLLLFISVNAFELPIFVNQSLADASIFSGSQLYWVLYNLRAVSSAFPIAYASRWPVLTAPRNADFGTLFNFPTHPLYISDIFFVFSLIVPIFVYSPLLSKLHRGRNAHSIYMLSVLVAIVTEIIIAGFSGPFSIVIPLLFRGGSLLNGLQDPLLALGWLATLTVALCLTSGTLVLVSSSLAQKPRVNSRLSTHVAKNRFGKAIAIIILVAILLSQIQAWTPDAVSSFNGITSRIKLPNSYHKLEAFLTENAKNSLVLGLPVSGGLEALNFSKGNVMWADDPIPLTTGVASLMDGGDAVTPTDLNLYDNLIYNVITYDTSTHNFSNILDAMNVKYVVLQTNMVVNVPGGPAPYNITNIEKFMHSQSNITEVKSFGPFIVYLNEGTRSLSWTAKPYYFDPSPGNPINSTSVNKSFLKSFANEAFFNVVGGKNVVFGRSYYSNGSLIEYVNYNSTLNIGNAYDAFSTIPLGLNSTSYNNVILNYSTSDPNVTTSIQLFSGPLNSSNVTGTWPSIYTPDFLNPNVNAIPPAGKGNKSAIFEIPQNYRGNKIDSIRLFIQYTPQNGENFSITFHSITFAQYISEEQWPLMFLDNSQFHSPVILGNSSHNQYKDIGLAARVSLRTISITKYLASMHNVSQGFVLVFSESYSPYWVLKTIAGKTVNSEHVIVDGYANGWRINQTGNLTIFIEYQAPPTHVIEYAVMGAFSALALILTYFILDWRCLSKRYCLRSKP